MERGDFETVLPPENLRPFVRRYLYANRPLQAGIVFRGSPTGYAYFTNFFGRSGAWGVIDGRAFKRVTRWFLYGQITDHEVTFHHPHCLQLLVCELSATCHHRLFGVTGQEILGMAAPLCEVAPEAAIAANDCFVLDAGASRDAHVAEANSFFARLADRALPPDDIVERTVLLLETANGAIRVSEICRQLGVGPRELNRRFTRIVGVSPKFFGQVMQINWVVGLLYANDTAGLARLAQEAGFYDQSHFTRAMRRFFREGPRAFLRSQHPALRSFLADSRQFGPASTARD